MQLNRKLVLVVAAGTALVAGGAGIAYGVAGDSEEQVGGPSAAKAEAAALNAVGGGTVSEVERQDGDGGGVYEVEVTRADGSQVEVHVDGAFEPVGTEADDDSGAGSDDENRAGSDDH